MSLAVKRGAKKADGAVDPALLLAWYDRHRRVLPWRARKGERADPYRVWLSEIMLQQTTVKAVAPYYARFLERFPTVTRLAAAPLDEVLSLWAGLGYYARARNLHACARAVAARHGGEFPGTEEELLTLPGIGAYTAAAIAAIAFDRRASPVDGNIERVIARLFTVEEELPAMPFHHRLRAGMQIARTRVIAEPGPELEHILERRRGELDDCREACEEPRVIRCDRLDSGLLQHDLGEPDAIRVRALAPSGAPRQHPAMAVVPGEQRRRIGGAKLLGGRFDC